MVEIRGWGYHTLLYTPSPSARCEVTLAATRKPANPGAPKLAAVTSQGWLALEEERGAALALPHHLVAQHMLHRQAVHLLQPPARAGWPL